MAIKTAKNGGSVITNLRGLELEIVKANMPQYFVILNFVLFQITWFACVLGSARGYPWLSITVVGLSLIWHLSQAKPKFIEAKWCLIALAIGAIFDQSILSLGIIQYHNNGWSESIVPIWILALWLAFALTFNVSMRWLRGKYLIALVFGAIGGPLAYIAAQKLGAVTLGEHSLIILGIGWGLITVAFSQISTKFDGFK